MSLTTTAVRPVSVGDALRPIGTVALTLTLVGVMALTMNWVSDNLVAPLFSYTGFTYVPAASYLVGAVVLMTSTVALVLPRRITRPSHVVLWALFVVCVAPTMLMSVSTGYLPGQTALLLSGAVGSAFALVAVGIGRSPVDALPATADSDVVPLGRFTISRNTLTWTFCTAYSVVTYGVMAATVGVHVRFLALDDIYDVRADYTADVGTGGALGYLLTGQAYVINPLFLARGIFRRRPSLIVLAVVGQFLLYSSTGFKAVLFSFLAVLGMAVLFRGRAVRRSLPFLVAPLGIMVVAATADELQGGITWTSVFTRRFMLTPGLLSSVYTDYFTQNPVAQYGYSFLSPWVDYPYDLPPPKRIANYLIPGSSGYANANLFADGFANFGWAGIFVAAGALFVWLKVVDRVSSGLPLRVTAMMLIMSSITLSNTSIFTAMLSHGLLLGTVVLAIAPRTGWEPRRETAAEPTTDASADARRPTRRKLARTGVVTGLAVTRQRHVAEAVSASQLLPSGRRAAGRRVARSTQPGRSTLSARSALHSVMAPSRRALRA